MPNGPGSIVDTGPLWAYCDLRESARVGSVGLSRCLAHLLEKFPVRRLNPVDLVALFGNSIVRLLERQLRRAVPGAAHLRGSGHKRLELVAQTLGERAQRRGARVHACVVDLDLTSHSNVPFSC